MRRRDGKSRTGTVEGGKGGEEANFASLFKARLRSQVHQR